jgi:predicted transcriptional regulator
MTMAHQLMNTLGFDLNGASRRLARVRRRAGRDGFRMTGLTRRPASERANIPTSYVWLGVGVLAATVAATMMRNSGSRLRSKRVSDVMVKNVLTIEGSASLQEAAQRMREANVGVLPVVEAGRLRGLVTDRDLVIRGMARGMDAAQTPVRYVATEDLARARPEWTVDDAMQVMSDAQIGRLPVVDEDDRVLGIVTLSSLALRSRDEHDTLETAKEVSRRSSRIA